MIKKTLPDKSGNPEGLKNNYNGWKVVQIIVCIVGKDLLRMFIELFYLQF